MIFCLRNGHVALVTRHEEKFSKAKAKPVWMFLLQLQLLSVIAPKTSSTEFRWTDDELDLLLKCCADFKSQKEYQRINWEDTRTKYEKIE